MWLSSCHPEADWLCPVEHSCAENTVRGMAQTLCVFLSWWWPPDSGAGGLLLQVDDDDCVRFLCLDCPAGTILDGCETKCVNCSPGWRCLLLQGVPVKGREKGSWEVRGRLVFGLPVSTCYSQTINHHHHHHHLTLSSLS